ncbi:MAG: hypothetical protein ACK5WZ_14425 [Pseudobdellovibrionaceae bacterium]
MKFSSLFLSMFFVTSVSQAGIMIEPYLGYEFGTQSAKYKSTYLPNASADLGGVISGSNLGARLGYNFIGLWAALDYLMATSGSVKYDASGMNSSDLARSTAGVTFGFDFPILIRVWGGYILKDEAKLKSSGSETTLTGRGYKLGVGFQGLPFISLNLEYYARNYTDHGGTAKNAGAGYDFDAAYNEFKHNTYLVSVSLPLDF